MRSRKLLYSLLPLLLFNFAAYSQIKADREASSLKGPVKTLRLETSLFTAGREATRKPWQQITFDENGNYLELTIYSNDYPSTYKFLNKYDPAGNMLEVAREGSGEKQLFVRHSKENQVEKITQTNDGHPLDKWVYTFDSKGNKTKEEHVTIDKNLGRRFLQPIDVIIFSYDSRGLLQAEEYFNEDGSKASSPIPIVPIHRRVFAYDEHDRKSEVITYKLDGGLFNKQVIKYDNRNNVTESTTYNALLLPVSKEVYFDYDDAGNWGKKIVSKVSAKDLTVFEPTQTHYQVITYYPGR
jgi:hypothetical protein